MRISKAKSAGMLKRGGIQGTIKICFFLMGGRYLKYRKIITYRVKWKDTDYVTFCTIILTLEQNIFLYVWKKSKRKEMY